jgi:hypothetical protein
MVLLFLVPGFCSLWLILGFCLVGACLPRFLLLAHPSSHNQVHCGSVPLACDTTCHVGTDKASNRVHYDLPYGKLKSGNNPPRSYGGQTSPPNSPPAPSPPLVRGPHGSDPRGCLAQVIDMERGPVPAGLAQEGQASAALARLEHLAAQQGRASRPDALLEKRRPRRVPHLPITPPPSLTTSTKLLLSPNDCHPHVTSA